MALGIKLGPHRQARLTSFIPSWFEEEDASLSPGNSAWPVSCPGTWHPQGILKKGPGPGAFFGDKLDACGIPENVPASKSDHWKSHILRQNRTAFPTLSTGRCVGGHQGSPPAHRLGLSCTGSSWHCPSACHSQVHLQSQAGDVLPSGSPLN